MSSVTEVGFFHWPVGCPKPTGDTKPTKKYVENWLSENKRSASSFERTSYGTYVGVTALVLGTIGSLFGLAKDNKVAKWAGSVLALVGAAAALIGKFCGLEFNILDDLHSKVLFKANTEVDDKEIEKVGIKDKEVMIDVPGTENEKLHGYYLPSPVASEKAVIYLHGRAHNNGNSARACMKIQEHVPVNVLMADYRGFGKSAGKATPEGVVEDAKAMYDYLIQKGFKSENITIYGHSLGGAIAIELASKMKDKVRNLVIQSSFSSAKEVAKEYKKKYLSFVPEVIANLVDRISPDVFDSKETIKNIDPNTRLLIFHGSDDEYIAAEQSNTLLDNASATDKHLVVLKGVKHNDFFEHFDTDPGYIAELKKFLKIDSIVVPQSEQKVA